MIPDKTKTGMMKNFNFCKKIVLRFIKLSLILVILAYFPGDVFAIVDPLAVPNNKLGIHIITASKDEASPAAQLVNSGGDWGYITVLIESKDRNQNKWQEFFDTLRKWHLIPLVRLATQPDGNFWIRPDETDAQTWADFLDSLNWPAKNRYVVVYNEPNHAQEWGNQVDAKLYAEILDKTITALKNKNRDFFVLNAGFDASSPSEPPAYQDELIFLKQMEEAVPGIFNKLDGWVSHSYPNPGFAGSPDALGKGTVGTWAWELSALGSLGVTKNLPVFITETGWKHAEGLKFEPYLPSAQTVADYYLESFRNVWSNSQIVAVTPFLLNYQEYPFDHFSFKKISDSSFYPQYKVLADMPKVSGKPVQEIRAKLSKGEIFSSVVAGETYQIGLTFENTGQSIWGEDSVKLSALQGGRELGIGEIEIPKGVKVEPKQSYTFDFKIKAPQSGIFKTKLNLYSGGKVFDSDPFEFTTEVKAPVILQIKALLKWKKNFAGDYFLSIAGPASNTIKQVNLDGNGSSEPFEARFLLPDYSADFTLEKYSAYKPKLVRQTLKSGLNTIDFGTLDPALFENIIHPGTFWSLLPFSN